MHFSEALQHYLLADKDRRDVGVIDKVLKAIKLVKVLITLYLAKVAPIEQSQYRSSLLDPLK